MLGQRRRLDTRHAENEAGAVRRILKFERNLRQQIEKHLDQLWATQKELRLSPENVQAVVEIALELAGQPPLIPAEGQGSVASLTGAGEQKSAPSPIRNPKPVLSAAEVSETCTELHPELDEGRSRSIQNRSRP